MFKEGKKRGEVREGTDRERVEVKEEEERRRKRGKKKPL